jgi:hypothetical protein
MTTMATYPSAGPQDTVALTKPLVGGAVRRTTSIDVNRPNGFDGGAAVEVRGRDVRQTSDDRIEVIGAVSGGITVEPINGTVTGAEWRGATTTPNIIGLSVRRGWTTAISTALRGDRSLAATLVEDLGGAFLVSGYSALRAGLIGGAGDYAVQAADARSDICAGSKAGGDAEVYLRTTGTFAAPMGPDASEALVSEGWHGIGRAAPHTVRRLRRLDVSRSDDGVDVDAHFRDTYASPDAPEMVMHEYTVRASVDDADVITSIEVMARVLPWDSCPNAVASAQSAVGLKLEGLPAHARRDMRGPTTCTHLNSTVRSLGDVAALKRLLDI